MQTVIEKVATAIAALGLLGSGVVHAMTLLGGPPPPLVAYALLAGAALTQLLAMIVAPRPSSPEPWTRKQLRDAVLDAVPFELRASLYALLGYALVQLGLLVASFEPASLASLLTTVPGLRLFSSVWLVLYFSALVACAAAGRSSRRPERVPSRSGARR